ncbi:MAG TPA: hypothetical protein ENK06_09140 [Gammaproteobacteria bacterium]|nr:hypothetical protein [Gammaproteobacteria bacterium]
MTSAWTQPEDIRKQIQRLWDRGLILSSLLSEEALFPIRLQLKKPSSKALSENFEQVRLWIRSLQKIKNLRLEMKTVQHRVLGENQIPESIWLDNLDDATQLLRVKNEVRKFSDLVSITRAKNPALISWIETHSIKALQLSEHWEKLLAVVDWLKRNPRPGIYIRQVDIPGVDTKFIENHRNILMTLLDISLPESAIDGQAVGTRQFSKRYGFLDKPTRVRFRLLDSDIRLVPGECQDLTLSHADFRCLYENDQFKTKLRTVFITENEINFLAFPKMPNSMVIFGGGYGFEFLRHVPWLSHLAIYYWGDIDTHGFAILDQLRTQLPQTKSILMDEATLVAHEIFWVQEGKPERRELTHLSQAEYQLYTNLIHHKFADRLRLEQERISYSHLLNALRRLKLRRE